MEENFEAGLSRRSFLIGSGVLLLPVPTWAQTDRGVEMRWRLDGEGDVAHEMVSGGEDAIASRTGHAMWVGSGTERALRLDGYSVWVTHAASRQSGDLRASSICAWIALESYPVSEAAIFDDRYLRLSIDKWGYVALAARSGKEWSRCISGHPLPRAAWMHLAGTVSEKGKLAIIYNGLVCGSSLLPESPVKQAPDRQVFLARSSDSPLLADVFPTGVLNGLIKDVCVYREELSPAALSRILNGARPNEKPELAINGDWCGSDPQRPQYHAMPPRAWTNEPHGLVRFQNEYHLFYQKNANGPYWGNINWGHMTSPDLREWTEQQVALSPEHGADAAGCWSGSVIEHKGKLAIIYTSADGQRASISLALSEDGIHFTKFDGNPIIPAPPEGLNLAEFRDPFVWREGNSYYLIIGSAVKNVGGTALLYRSDDLINWEFKRPLLVGDREDSGVFWEMPIFLKMGDKHVLIVCEVPGRASYWVGTWKDEAFSPLSLEPRRLDLFNHLLSPTPHATRDGEIIAMGIIPDQRSPKECWRAGWAHLYSLPRQLCLDSQGRLEQRPWEAIAKWMSGPIVLSKVSLEDGVLNALNGASGKCVHVRAVFRKETSRAIEVVLRRSPDDREQTVLRYEWEIGRLVLDRTKSSLGSQVKRDAEEATYFPRQEGVLDFDIYLDASVIEVFLDERAAFAARIYPSLEESTGLAARSLGGGAEIESMTISSLAKGVARS